MQRIIITIFIHFSLTSFAQAENWRTLTDSLKLQLNTEMSNEEKLETYSLLISSLVENEPEKAFEYAIEEYNLAVELDNKEAIVYGLLHQCDFYAIIGEYNTAFMMAYEALELAKPDIHLYAMCHNRIATIHTGVKNYDEALYHNKKSLVYSVEMDDSVNIMVDLHNIALDYVSLGSYDSALYLFNFVNQFEIRNNKRPDSYALTNIGYVHYERGDYDSALFFHLQAYEYDRNDDMKYLICLDEQYIAETYYKMKRYDKAREFANKSIAGANELNAFDVAHENYKILYQVNQEEGNYERALEYSLLYSAIQDSLDKKGKQSLLLGLETRYKVKEQSEKLALLEKQKSLYLGYGIIGFLFILILSVFGFQVYRRQKMYHELSRELQGTNESKERLISVISHDLRGSVGALRTASKAIGDGLTDLESTREIMASFFPVADATYDLLENMLTWAKCNKEQIVPVFEQINIQELINKCIEHTLQQAEAKKISVINNVSDIMVSSDKNMLLSIIRNIIGNAIKFSHIESKVLIDQQVEPDRLVLYVADNGIGMNREALEKIFKTPEEVQASGTMGERGSGMGMMICKSFLDSLNGEIWAKSTPGSGSTFYFSIPFDKN